MRNASPSSAGGHLIFVCPRFAEGATVGGAETLLKALAMRAQKLGFQVEFLATCARDHFTWRNAIEPGRRVIAGLPVHFFPVDENRNVGEFLRIQEVISRNGNYAPAEEKTWIENSVNSRALCEHLRRASASCEKIIIGPYLFGLSYFAAQACPQKTLLVPCLHDEGFARVRLIADMFRQSAGCLFNSRPEMEFARGLYSLPEEKCAVVGMGLDDFSSSGAEFASRHKLQAPYLIYSGRREEGKGTPLLLDYAGLFRKRSGLDLKIVFTGSGPIHAPPELKPHILDLGFVSEDEKHAAMAGALAFCHPSVNESFGIVLLESWLAGTPALVHARCAVTAFHCRRSGGGLWFASYPEFEEALLLLHNDRSLRAKMGRAGREYVLREYSWETVENKFRSALEQFA